MHCLVCGAVHATCGPVGTGTPVTLDGPTQESYTVNELREYRVNLNGIETTAMLSPEDAVLYGAVPVEPAPQIVTVRSVEVPNTARRAATRAR